ncbi:MAG: aminodeoxychorismate synthase, component I [Planctomycetes bacterium RBG_16_59_8]|nr:MAG: aminodeoxychorismate synthase, component I [Planctomycetes bacterium RBG_16_59_8]
MTDITLPQDYLEYFAVIAKQPYPFLLDSAIRDEASGRYSLMGSCPFMVLTSKGDRITVRRGSRRSTIRGNPFDVLAEILKNFRVPDPPRGISFPTGCVGYFGYDLCHFIEKLPRKAKDDLPFPDLFLAFYDRVVCIDHVRKKVSLVSVDFGEKRIVSSPRKEVRPSAQTAFETVIDSNFTKEEYMATVEKAKEQIAAGEIYQANLSQRFHVRSSAHPFRIFRNLRQVSPAPYTAYLHFDDMAFISSSPELFLSLEGRKAVSRPIKGTRKRGRGKEEDEALRKELLESGKDDAELSMIVDLVRNDIGRVSEYGSVNVPQPKILDSFPTVHHLSAVVEGKLRKEAGVVDLLKALFPGGSITGAPKIRAMEIIDELEPTRRGPYTGAFGCIGFDGNANLAMSIRIVLCSGENLYFQVGGGIVADSVPEQEYEETIVKAEGILRSLELK